MIDEWVSRAQLQKELVKREKKLACDDDQAEEAEAEAEAQMRRFGRHR